MGSFHVLHWIPDGRMHIFNGYNEIIETVIWGLRSLGHDVEYAVNARSRGGRPIVFGAQMMNAPILRQLPDDAIIYNLEQLDGLESTGRRMDEFAYMAERFAVWDYSAVNLARWVGGFGARDARHVPIGFAPPLVRVPHAAAPDIDALMYGAPSPRRFAVLHELCARGLSAMFVCGLYGAARDALIGRAKVVVNVTSDPHSTIFSIVRVAYLLANRKAVIADIAAAERDITDAVAFASLDGVAELCRRVVDDDALRLRLERQGPAIMARRDIRIILAAALSGSPPGPGEHGAH